MPPTWSVQHCQHSGTFLLHLQCLAISRVDEGYAKADTLYAGCARGKIRAWHLDSLGARGEEQTGEFPGRLERKVRALACAGHVLLCGDNAGHVRAWDLTTRTPTGREVAEAHTAGVRAIAVEPISNVVYTAGDDRVVRLWGEMSATEYANLQHEQDRI